MNSAQTGGAIVLASDSQLIMDGSVFTDNHADGNGGALYVSAGADVDLEGAFLSNSSDGQGGAIFNQGIISLNRVRLLENSAQNGGALYNGSGGQVEIVASSLKDNRAVGAGGAIFNSQGAINLIKSSLVGNRASDGAGAWLSLGSFMQITNSTISANRDSNRGAGVMNSGGQLVIRFSTIFNNAPHSGLFVLDGDTLVDNSIVAGNQGGNCSGEITSEGHNLKGDDTCGSLAEGDIIESDAGLSGLVPAGSTYHHPLELDSPAIDAGANLNCPDDDQGGHSRPQGEACDIGAIELEDLLAAQLEAPTMPPVQAGESTSVPVTVQASSCTYTALVNLFCRQGPGVVYPQVDSFVPGQSASVNGQSQDGNYYYVVGPNSGQTCAVPSGDEFGEVSGACQGLPQFTPQPVPPTATNSPVPPTETAEANSTISGTVWEDVDGGQDIDGGEPRLGSVTVELRAGGCGGGVSQTTTTNGNGGYGFGGLSAGSYCVRVELPPGNWAATTPDFPANQAPTREVAVGASELLVGVNFGLQQVVQ
jgi:predicted outer membrane repeat protein